MTLLYKYLFRKVVIDLFLILVEKGETTNLSKISREINVSYSHVINTVNDIFLQDGWFEMTHKGRDNYHTPTKKAKELYELLKKAESILKSRPPYSPK